jgi:hypothetical protein
MVIACGYGCVETMEWVTMAAQAGKDNSTDQAYFMWSDYGPIYSNIRTLEAPMQTRFCQYGLGNCNTTWGGGMERGSVNLCHEWELMIQRECFDDGT